MKVYIQVQKNWSIWIFVHKEGMLWDNLMVGGKLNEYTLIKHAFPRKKKKNFWDYLIINSVLLKKKIKSITTVYKTYSINLKWIHLRVSIHLGIELVRFWIYYFGSIVPNGL